MFKGKILHQGAIEITGIVFTIRSSKLRTFLEVGYGFDKIQVVALSAGLPKITLRSYVSVKGQLTPLPPAIYSMLPYEITDATVIVLSLATEDTVSRCPPQSSAETRLSQRHHYFRDPEFVRIMKLSDILCKAFRLHFEGTLCTEITPPSFTGMECEGGATLFKIAHPAKTTGDIPAFLTQSSQFALEMMLPGIGDCFCVAPSYRAEHSHTRRHLTEFTHVEAEWGGIISFEDHLDKLRQLLIGTITYFLRLGEKELKALDLYERVQGLLSMCQDIVVLTHHEAIQKCRELGIKKDGTDGTFTEFGDRDDIPEAQERKLIDTIGKIVFLVKFPQEFKSFYMALDPSDPSLVLGCDVEVPGVGEIVGSGVREATYDGLLSRLKSAGLKPEDYSEYLELRQSGFCMTSGMGLGLGRMLCWLLGKSSIREVVAFPRFPGYLRP